MIFEQDNMAEKIGKFFGFLFSYAVFTTILYLVLLHSKRLPDSWNYACIMMITIAVAIAGAAAKRFLK
jgi:hypothetical protein